MEEAADPVEEGPRAASFIKDQKCRLVCLGADRESISPIGMKGFFEQLEMYITSKFKMTQYSGWRSQIY